MGDVIVLAERVRKSIADRGTTETARRLGIPIDSTLRIGAGSRVKRATENTAHQNAHLLADELPTPPEAA